MKPKLERKHRVERPKRMRKKTRKTLGEKCRKTIWTLLVSNILTAKNFSNKAFCCVTINYRQRNSDSYYVKRLRWSTVKCYKAVSVCLDWSPNKFKTEFFHFCLRRIQIEPVRKVNRVITINSNVFSEQIDTLGKNKSRPADDLGNNGFSASIFANCFLNPRQTPTRLFDEKFPNNNCRSNRI